MNFPIEIYTIIIECLLIFYFFHKEVRPVYPSRRYIILFCISLFAVIMLSTLYTPMFIRLAIISLFLFLCYTFCFKCKIFQITYTIILFFVTSMFSDVIGAFVLSRLGISINELLGISEGRLIYNTTSKIIHLFLLVIIILFTNARFDSKALLHAIPLMLCNLSSIFILFAQYTTFIDNGKYSTFVMTTICMLVINIVVCGYTEIVKKSYELQKNQLCIQEQLAKQELYYQDIIARQDESRALWHDIKKYMLAMENLVSTKTRPAERRARNEESSPAKGKEGKIMKNRPVFSLEDARSRLPGEDSVLDSISCLPDNLIIRVPLSSIRKRRHETMHEFRKFASPPQEDYRTGAGNRQDD